MSTAQAEHAATPHDAILAGLTDEERAALAAPDEDDDAAAAAAAADPAADAAAAIKPAEGAADADASAEGNGGQTAAEGDTAAADGGAAAQPAAEAGASAEPSAAPQPGAPVFVAYAPEDAEAKLAAIGTAKSELDKKFDDGDITNAEYRRDLDALNKQERDIELDLREAKLAEKMENQRQKNEWDRECSGFLAAHPEYQGEANKEVFQKLNETVMVVARMNPQLSGPAILEKAHKFVQLEGNVPTAAPAPAPAKAAAAPAKPAVPKQVAQPSLHAVPAAQQAEAGEGRFASLRGLNGFQLEAALQKMSQADRDAFMAEPD